MTLENLRAEDRFHELMRSLPAGVCVVSAMGPAGPTGLTASSVTSLSLKPPLMVAGIRSSSQTLAAARAAGRFAISVLAADQATVALQFASQRGGADKYVGVAHRLEQGTPVIDGATAWVVCELTTCHSAGDHQLVIGRVCAMGRADDGPRPPLITHGGRLTTVIGSTDVQSGRSVSASAALNRTRRST